MFASLKELYSLLTEEQRKKLLRLQLLVILMSFAEIAGVVSIGPFMALVGDIERLQGAGALAELYRATGLSDPTDFLFWLGIAVLCVLSIAAMISTFTIWRLSLYGTRVGAELSSRLYRHYMHQPWLFHTTHTSSHLTNQVAQECLRITNTILIPLMQMNAKLVMALFMAVTIFIYNPMVAIVGLSIFVSAYLLLYHTVRRRLMANGRVVTAAQRERLKLMSEGFGGIKDVLLLGRQDIFTERFENASQRFARAQGTTQAMGQVPRYAMELVAFAGVILLVLYLLSAYKGNLGAILPVLSVYALAGFKMLPALQQVYTGVSQIRGNLAAFESLRGDLRACAGSDRDVMSSEEKTAAKTESWVPKHSIQLRNVTFTYPGKVAPALNGLSINIPANQTIGLVGASGSGKSTAIDLLLGLIEPQEGRLLIDGEPVTAENRHRWQRVIGFVPQSIFLADSSIRENIAFGLPPEMIEDERVRRAASMAHLDELIASLSDGLDTRVGERGVQLSGGQRQRIGIARALYQDAEVLVLDEATSALDGATERVVMNAIHDLSGNKTIIIIAHRFATVKMCEEIYMISSGSVIDNGSYEKLFDQNDVFRRMGGSA
ncbi:ABC transporter ATP-binding protein [Marinobacterium nitratireducens]|uniref:ABC transporter ATP-binding protein n=1 Tax=Marinobacterium nitratireducens TaxID=518897 RepID=A0A917ZLC0_9GAMM|nr:ABC transporter ATP-binding protein [Marinobacterium nitratireducens]GGO85130.1 ABC transporter ATP-binding protein [Marinobacterium nitratireducens]